MLRQITVSLFVLTGSCEGPWTAEGKVGASSVFVLPSLIHYTIPNLISEGAIVTSQVLVLFWARLMLFERHKIVCRPARPLAT